MITASAAARWFAGTPRAVIEKLSAAATVALMSEDVVGKLAVSGFEPLDGSPEEFAQLIARGMATWAAAAERQDELPPPHSITSSARASSVGGTSSPIAFAVLRLIASSYLVGFCTGRSAGLAPRRMRST